MVGKMVKESGKQTITVNGEDYPIHAYVYNQDLTITGTTQIGSSEDIGTNMVVLRVNGDLIVNSGAYLTAIGNSYGGPKGFLVYVTGTITNNGEISMTARGARAEGQDVYLWQNLNESYEYVPAYGASGGASVTCTYYADPKGGKQGASGSGRATGGGGSGGAVSAVYDGISGSGCYGTSYSGGSGGGGAFKGRAEGGTIYKGGNAVSGYEEAWRRRLWRWSWKSSRFKCCFRRCRYGNSCTEWNRRIINPLWKRNYK